MYRNLSAFLLFLSLLASPPLFAWNALGHMVVAQIAYQNLTPVAKAKVDSLVSKFRNEYPDITSFAQMAYWPDAIRSQKIETFTRWHYINVSFTRDGRKLNDVYDSDNAIWALKNINKVVKNDHANPYERARFLAFFAHIVGDLHQPLHTVDLVSAEHPNGDEGGNLYYVRYKNQRVKLHAIWDSGLEIFKQEPTVNNAINLCNHITAIYPQAYFGRRVKDLEPQNWLKEGMENAKSYVYNTPENQGVTQDYIENGKSISQQEIALAGYRLGALLNQLLV